ncbi:SIR2 family protein [Methylosinus sp. Sm6]|uniref:SIR2 family protein n=1 Tax=Methylosinus sp. Sm6 TaxID=2866948 RepID=UPI001C994C12|nr:SIR2 family protein [Methylosinus sp. Sm6]MBY6240072.1 SIR2 family protein [Methylosinus sp. Sm6]
MIELCPYQLISPVSAGESADLLAGKSKEDGLRRIQALLADWLRMENVVVLTAAGCSVGAGGRLMTGPSVNNLECLVLEAVESCPLTDEAKAVIAWKKTNHFGSGNFEEWLGYVFNASSLSSSNKSPIKAVYWKDDVLLTATGEKELRRLIEKAIFAECALELDRGELSGANTAGESSGHIPFLAKLIARDATLGRTHLFTLNYDTLFEQAMEELGIQYFDGFSGKANSRFDPAVYGLDVYYPGDVAEGRVRRFDKFLQFYKLHGSIHWRMDEADRFRAQHQDLAFAQAYRAAEPKGKAAMLVSAEFDTIESFGILPTCQKFTQTLDMPYAHLFRLFHARLNQPQTFLIVAGYGFGDDHVTRIIETALMNPSLVMLIVEPNPSAPIIERVKRYQSLGQRAFVLSERVEAGRGCSYKLATFADFAQNVMPDVKWLDDYKRLRAFEDQLKKAKDGPVEA